MAGNFAARRIATMAYQIEMEAQNIHDAHEQIEPLRAAIQATEKWIGDAA